MTSFWGLWTPPILKSCCTSIVFAPFLNEICVGIFWYTRNGDNMKEENKEKIIKTRSGNKKKAAQRKQSSVK